MMTAPSQTEFDLPSPGWDEESLCLAWVTQSDGRHWRDWWRGLPRYQREMMMNAYKGERLIAFACNRPMQPYSRFVPSREVIIQEEAIVARMIQDIREAAAQGKPMPCQPDPNMSPAELVAFRGRLARAIALGGICIVVEAAPAA